MSVIKAKQNESRLEVVVYASTVKGLLVDLMQRNFGIRDMEQLVRRKYANGTIEREDFPYYRALMYDTKSRLNELSMRLPGELYAAYVIFPTNLSEYEKRRQHKTDALALCAQIKHELQWTAERFDVDINEFSPVIKAIDREIDLIKKWRQRDNHWKSKFKDNLC